MLTARWLRTCIWRRETPQNPGGERSCSMRVSSGVHWQSNPSLPSPHLASSTSKDVHTNIRKMIIDWQEEQKGGFLWGLQLLVECTVPSQMSGYNSFNGSPKVGLQKNLGQTSVGQSCYFWIVLLVTSAVLYFLYGRLALEMVLAVKLVFKWNLPKVQIFQILGTSKDSQTPIING